MNADGSEARDRVVDMLFTIAGDVVPALDTPDPRFAQMPAHVRYSATIVATVVEHPKYAEILHVLEGDQQLGRFAAAGDQGLFLWTSTGAGWRLVSPMLPPSLIGSARVRAIATGRDIRAPGTLRDVIGETVEALRRLLDGEIVEVPVATAFEGFALPKGVRVATPWGELRQALPDEQFLSPFGEVAPGAVLESRMPIRMAVGEDRPQNLTDTGLEEAQLKLAKAGGWVTLALLLAIDRDEYAIADAVWRTDVIPGQAGLSFTGRQPRARFLPRLPADPLSAEDIDDLARWTTLVESHYNDSIETAVNRTLSAVRERSAVDDALIDAVIAWENLCGGGGTTEVNFRVTTALAHLLEGDASKRDDFRKRLGKVYGIRSKVLHGDVVSAKDKIDERKELAIRTAVEALRKFFADVPHLLSDGQRGLRLILGAAGSAEADSASAEGADTVQSQKPSSAPSA